MAKRIPRLEIFLFRLYIYEKLIPDAQKAVQGAIDVRERIVLSRMKARRKGGRSSMVDHREL